MPLYGTEPLWMDLAGGERKLRKRDKNGRFVKVSTIKSMRKSKRRSKASKKRQSKASRTRQSKASRTRQSKRKTAKKRKNSVMVSCTKNGPVVKRKI